MRVVENQCVDCCLERHNCTFCPLNEDAEFIYCDECGEQIDSETGVHYKGKDLCHSCLAKRLIEEGVVASIDESEE